MSPEEEKMRQLAKELMLAMNALNASVVGFNHIINGEKYRFSLTFSVTRVVGLDANANNKLQN